VELAKHNTAEDCYICISGRVFDVTTWLADHPGGVEVILDLAGKDATKEFEEIGHSEYAVEVSEKFLIGNLEGGQITQMKTGTYESVASSGQKSSSSNSNGLPGGETPDDSGAYLFGAVVVTAAAAFAMYLMRS